MGLLNGGGAAILGGIFSGIYLPAKVYAETSVYDDYGELTTIETVRDCKAQVDVMTEAMRAQEGAADGDRRILILSTSLSGNLDSDSEVEVLEGPYAGSRYLVSNITRDPCGAYHEARGRKAS